MRWIRTFREVSSNDVGFVGGKNASLGEVLNALTPKGIRVPDGDAIMADAYRFFVRSSGLESALRTLISDPIALRRTAARAGDHRETLDWSWERPATSVPHWQ
jgi:pyruvate,water dikinase